MSNSKTVVSDQKKDQIKKDIMNSGYSFSLKKYKSAAKKRKLIESDNFNRRYLRNNI